VIQIADRARSQWGIEVQNAAGADLKDPGVGEGPIKIDSIGRTGAADIDYALVIKAAACPTGIDV